MAFSITDYIFWFLPEPLINSIEVSVANMIDMNDLNKINKLALGE